MIKPLRRNHRYIWMLWALLLPPGIIFAWLVVPDDSPVKLLQNAQAGLLPVIVQSKKGGAYTINIRSNAGKSQWQLEWINHKALSVPSAVIYKGVNKDISQNELIGRIEARGSYVFPLTGNGDSNKLMKLTLYDFIHEKTIEQIECK